MQTEKIEITDSEMEQVMYWAKLCESSIDSMTTAPQTQSSLVAAIGAET